MTWLADTASLLAGGQEDRCALHDAHVLTTVDVDLRSHGVPDYPTGELGWVQPVYLGESVPGYCTADQEVSRSIASQGVWEAFGSLLAAQILVCEPGTVVDVGANVGWYSNLAGSFGHDVLAIDADEENIAAIEAGWWMNDWQGRLATCRGWIGPESVQVEPHPIRLLKVDLEGLEPCALGVFARSLAAGLVDYVLAEVSPVLGDVSWVDDLVGIGYRAYRVPEKSFPVHVFESDPVAATLDWGPLARHHITYQADALFVGPHVL